MRRWLILGAIIWAWIGASVPYHVTAQDTTGSAQITSPKTEDVLFGLVSIQGTASNANMQRYVLEFDLQDNSQEQWFPIAGPITQQVKAGVLGQWNTTTVTDGRYQIRLRVVLRDGTVLSSIVQNLHVTNRQPTSLPTGLPSATLIPPRGSPTAGPSPTPIIQQPPTDTPRPATATAIPAAIVPTAADSTGSGGPPIVVVFQAVQNSFCSGVTLALIAFAVFGVYSLIHSRLRPGIRRMFRR